MLAAIELPPIETAEGAASELEPEFPDAAPFGELTEPTFPLENPVPAWLFTEPPFAGAGADEPDPPFPF